jgi:hypothetical protein
MRIEDARDGADALQGEEEAHEIETCWKRQRRAVAGAHPFVNELPCNAFRVVKELAVRQRLVPERERQIVATITRTPFQMAGNAGVVADHRRSLSFVRPERPIITETSGFAQDFRGAAA